MELISVVVPIRPNCATLRRTLSSITDQTYQNWEIVALLDRDNGLNEKVLTELVPDSKLVMIRVNLPESGFPSVLNSGIQAAKGEIVARLDDDDFADRERFSRQVSLLSNQKEIGLVSGWTKVISPNGELLYTIKPPSRSIDIKSELLKQNVISHSSVMFRKDLFELVDGYRDGLTGCEDYDLWLRLLTVTEFASVQDTVVTYLMNPSGMTKSRIPSSSLRLLRKSRKEASQHLSHGSLSYFLRSYKWEASNVLRRLLQRLRWGVPK